MTQISIAIHEARRRKIHAALDAALKDLIELDRILPAQVMVELHAAGKDIFVTITFGTRKDKSSIPERL